MTRTRPKGLVLATEEGAASFPAAGTIPRHLMPVYDQPMIHYSIEVLARAGVREIAIVAPAENHASLRSLMGDGSTYDLAIDYLAAPGAAGLPQACLAARDWLSGGPIAAIRGDSIFHSGNLERRMRAAFRRDTATLFAAPVENPEYHDIVSFDPNGRVAGIARRPAAARSRFASTGLCLLPSDAAERSLRLLQKADGATGVDLLRDYLDEAMLEVQCLDGAALWFEIRTPEALYRASRAVRRVSLHSQGPGSLRGFRSAIPVPPDDALRSIA